MRWYLDTSAFMKFYCNEAGTESMYEPFGNYAISHTIATSQYTAVEAASAAQRLCNAGQMEKFTKEKLIDEIAASEEGVEMLSITWNSLKGAMGLISKYNLRGGDAIQLYAALDYKSSKPDEMVFVCSDARLNDAAKKEGLDIYDPASMKPGDWLKSIGNAP